MLMVKTLCPPKLAPDKQNITSESFDSFFQNQHRSLSFSLSLQVVLFHELLVITFIVWWQRPRWLQHTVQFQYSGDWLFLIVADHITP